jgi:hypothetical protein
MEHVDPGPLFGVLTATLFVVAAVAIVMVVLNHRRRIRELLSRERMAALEKGVEIPWELDAARPRRASRLQLKAGFLLCGLGVGLAAAAGLTREPVGNGPLPFGVFLLITGLTLIVYDVLFGRHEWRQATELDEELTRAYIRRLEGSAGHVHEASGKGDAGR